MVDSLSFKIIWLANLKKDADREFLKFPAFEAFTSMYFCLEKLEKAKKPLMLDSLKKDCPSTCDPKLWEWICNTTLDAIAQGLPLLEIKMAYLSLIIQYATDRWIDLADINTEQIPQIAKENVEKLWLSAPSV